MSSLIDAVKVAVLLFETPFDATRAVCPFLPFSLDPPLKMRTRQEFLAEFSRYFPDLAEKAPADSPQTLLKTPFFSAPPTLDEAFAYCRRLTRAHYENFAVDSFVLPRRLRTPFRVVYSYCRWADDLGDELGNAALSLAALDRWGAGLNAAFDRAKRDDSSVSSTQTAPLAHPVFIALTEIFRRFPNLPREPFADLLQAFRLDQTRRTWTSFADLEDYCRFSANPVGRIVLGLFLDRPTSRQLAESDAICSGLQLANFWQDVARDAQIGRSYLPTDVFARNGGDFESTLRELVAATREKIEFGRPLPTTLPFRLRLVVSLFRDAGLAVLDSIERAGFQTDVRRPTISKARRLRIIARTLVFETFSALFSRKPNRAR